MKKISIFIFVLIISISSGCDDILNTIHDDIDAGQQVVLADSTVPDGAKQDGRTWETAFNNIQVAVDHAYAKGIPAVWAAGTFTNEGNGGDNEPVLTMRSGITVYGGFTGNNGKQESDLDERSYSFNFRDEEDGLDPEDTANDAEYGTIESANTVFDGYNDSTGSNSYHVVIGADNASLDGIAIINGNANSNTPDVLNSYGGGLFNDGVSLSIRNCCFNKNNSSERGGAIYNFNDASSTISNCNFISNTSNYGGAMYNYPGNSIINIRDCIFDHNESLSPNSGAITCIEIYSLVINECTFKNNKNTVSGGEYTGAVYIESINQPVYINECNFINNSGSEGGALFIENSYAPVSLHDCTFENNNATFGGGIYIKGTEVPIYDSHFIENNASSGGAIYTENTSNANVTIINSEFSDNSATGTSANGGAISLNTGDLNIDRCTFNGNICNTYYGGTLLFYATTSSSSLKICNSYFYNNASYMGGALHIRHSSSGGVIDNTLINLAFYNNNATSQGGAIYTNIASLNVYNTIFYLNSDGSSGDNIFQENGNALYLYNSFFYNGIREFTGTYVHDECIEDDSLSPFISTVETDIDFLYPNDTTGVRDSGTTDTGVLPSGFIMPTTDLAGNSRITGSEIDMGAYESQP